MLPSGMAEVMGIRSGRDIVAARLRQPTVGSWNAILVMVTNANPNAGRNRKRIRIPLT